jgi:hypothetical protein
LRLMTARKQRQSSDSKTYTKVGTKSERLRLL